MILLLGIRVAWQVICRVLRIFSQQRSERWNCPEKSSLWLIYLCHLMACLNLISRRYTGSKLRSCSLQATFAILSCSTVTWCTGDSHIFFFYTQQDLIINQGPEVDLLHWIYSAMLPLDDCGLWIVAFCKHKHVFQLMFISPLNTWHSFEHQNLIWIIPTKWLLVPTSDNLLI